jgi:signal transduction histidine kinase/ligand-binding sensor domain-containing protein/DNA-binding response OmpR family regulator
MMRRYLLIALFIVQSLLSTAVETATLYSSVQLPSTRFTHIIQDRMGFIWIGTESGLCRFDGYQFVTYRHDTYDGLPSNHVTSFCIDHGGNLWIGTTKGICRYDAAGDRFQKYVINNDRTVTPHIECITQLHDGTILAGTSGLGTYAVIPNDTLIAKTSIFSYHDEDDFYRKMHQDRQGNVWKMMQLGEFMRFTLVKGRWRETLHMKSTFGNVIDFVDRPDGGLVVVAQFGCYVFGHGKPQSWAYADFRSPVRSVTLTPQGRMVLGTEGQGMWMERQPNAMPHPLGDRQYAGMFEQLSAVSAPFDYNTSDIQTLAFDSQQNIWLGCNMKGLLFIPHANELFSQWVLSWQGKVPGTAVSSACLFGPGILCNVKSNGLFLLNPSTGVVVSVSNSIKDADCVYRDRQGSTWVAEEKRLFTLSPGLTPQTIYPKTFDAPVNVMADDGQGHYFLSAFGQGLMVWDRQRGATTHYTMYQRERKLGFLCNDWIFSLLYDSRGLLWAGTSSGVSCFNPKTTSFKAFGWHNILDGYACQCLTEDAEGNIIIGTNHGLMIYRPGKPDAEPFPRAEQMRVNTIESVITDRQGNVWCSTDNGIWVYSKRSRQWSAYVMSSGLHHREYAHDIALSMGDDQLLFANSEGLVSFSPRQVISTKFKVGRLCLTRFTTASDNSLDIRATQFSLPYDDNSFTMAFSTFDYGHENDVLLEYHLDNDPWNVNAPGDNTISFRRVSSGTYKLHVRVMAGGGASPEVVYTIHIRAPWYRSWWAMLVYLLLLAAGGYGAFSIYTRKKSIEAQESKMQFLINATHDIRTPLTLIISPLHKLLLRQWDADTHDSLSLIDRNVRRLQTLVNQILDLRKLDKSMYTLNRTETDLTLLASETLKSFTAAADDKGITLSLTSPQHVTAWVDAGVVGKVLMNLLSNAFKYTDRGAITVSVGQQGERAVIEVADTGTGINPKELPHIFTRFYQPKGSKGGSGIGLNLCKQLVELHHGTITAQNRTDTQDTVFRVELPMEQPAAASEPTVPSAPVTPPSAASSSAEPSADESSSAPSATSSKSKYRILFVDDDAELVDYLKTEFAPYYHVMTAANGSEGLHDVLTDAPDLVVSDIMMPVMDGFSMLRSIKTNPMVSHTPVILLTSEASVANRLEGLSKGADAFLNKPFITDELHVLIDNILERNRRLRGKFSGAVNQADKVEEVEMQDKDQELMDRVMKSVNANLGNSDYTVDQLCSDVGLSRSQLHRRMKELTGISTTTFIMNIRLEQAARLLKEKHVDVQQVAWATGFTNPSHFSRVFKKHFGMSPTAYAGT